MVQMLIRKGANVNAVSFVVRTTPLMVATFWGNHRTEMNQFRVLGMDVSFFFSGHRDVVDLLIKNGSDVNKRDADNQTALDSAIQYRPEIVSLLKKNGAV